MYAIENNIKSTLNKYYSQSSYHETSSSQHSATMPHAITQEYCDEITERSDIKETVEHSLVEHLSEES